MFDLNYQLDQKNWIENNKYFITIFLSKYIKYIIYYALTLAENNISQIKNHCQIETIYYWYRCELRRDNVGSLSMRSTYLSWIMADNKVSSKINNLPRVMLQIFYPSELSKVCTCININAN